MSEPTERSPSPIPVPWPFRLPRDLEPSHPLCDHVPREREREQRSTAQRLWDAEWEEIDRGYMQARDARRRTERTHQQTMSPPIPPQSYQRQPKKGHRDPSVDSRGDPRRGRERWRSLGQSYARDNPDNEWVEVPKPTLQPETDIYGFSPGDPFYRPHLRYAPREDDLGDAPRGQGAMPPVTIGPPAHAIGRPDMQPPQSANGSGRGHVQPVDRRNATHSIPRPSSPPPMPHGSRDMHRDLGAAGHGFTRPSRSTQQSRYHDPRQPTQPNDVRGSAGHDHSSRGGEGYVTLKLGDEGLNLWDWSED